MTDYQFPERTDTMPHIGTIVSTELHIKDYAIAGVVDRRFKSGYRVKPERGVRIWIDFKMVRVGQYQTGQYWCVGDPKKFTFGIYQIVEITLDYAKFISIMLNQNNNKLNLVIPDKINMLYYGFGFASEGSVLSSP